MGGASALHEAQPIEMSFWTPVTPGAAHAVVAATCLSCGEWTDPVSRTLPPWALTVTVLGSKTKNDAARA